MKQGTVIVRIIMLVLFVGVVAYFGVYVWSSLTSSTVTAALYTQTCEEDLDVSGWFFRDERVLEDTNALAEMLAGEGEKVGKGDVVARLYTSTEGYQLQQELDEAQANLTSLQYIQSRTGESADTEAQDESIVSAFTALRYAVSTGDLSSVSSNADELRTQIFRRDYTYSGTDTLSAQIQAAEELVDSLSSGAGGAYTTVTAPVAGLFSSVEDGYEGIMTVSALEGLTPSRLDALVSSGREPASALGKLITNNGWYYACTLSTQEADTFYEGNRVTLRFAASSREFDATVLQRSEEEDGRVTVVFTSNSYAALLTALREEDAQVILDSATGFRVQKRAIRVNDEGQTGLYRVSGAQAEWVSVNVIWDDGDYYLVEEAVSDSPTALEEAARLRDGDTIVIRGEDMFSGKVIDQ